MCGIEIKWNYILESKCWTATIFLGRDGYGSLRWSGSGRQRCRGQRQRRPKGYVPRGRIGVDQRFAWRLFGGHVKVSRDGSSPSKKEPATQPRYLLLPSPALQNNEYCLVVLLKWNGHLVHFNSRQGKAAVQDSKPIRLSLPSATSKTESIYVWTLKKRIQSSSRNHARHDIHPARPPASDQHMGGGICAASPASPVDDEVNVGAPTCKFPRPANDGKLSPFPYIFHFSIQKRREPHCVAGELEQQETPDAR